MELRAGVIACTLFMSLVLAINAEESESKKDVMSAKVVSCTG